MSSPYPHFRYNRVYTETVKLVILDWSGTAVDYGCIAPAIVFKKLFETKGINITMELLG